MLYPVPTLRVVNSNGRFLLTPREEQVVALVADGLTNRGVAVELGLSEHTIKKYLLRIFDKVGISSRVELVLYAYVARRASPGGMDAEQHRLSEEGKADVQWQNAERRGDCSVTSSGSQSHSQSKVARRWTVIASGLLLLALALVVIYTGPNAFLSPVALVVVAAIGLAALLLQVWFRRDLPNIHPPLWLNVLGILVPWYRCSRMTSG